MGLPGIKIVGTTTDEMFGKDQPMADNDLYDAEGLGDEKQPKQPRVERPPQDKPIDGKMAKSEIQRALCLLYNLGHRFARIDRRYKPTDFTEEADGLYDLVSQHSPLRIILRLASPLAAIGALWEKVDDTMDRVKKKKDPATPDQPVTQPETELAANGRGSKRAPFKA